MKRVLLIAVLILLTITQAISAQDGPVQIPFPEDPQQITAATFEEQVLELVNQERWNNGQLPPLKGVLELNNSAEGHSTNMALYDFFAHCDLHTGKKFYTRIIDAGYNNYSNVGENIAVGQTTPAAAIYSWMTSPYGHREAILSTTYREIGVGYFYQNNDQGNIRRDLDSNCVADSWNNGPYGHYWTQNFGKRNSVYPVVINREAYETETRQVDLYMYGQGWATEMRFRNENGTWSSWQVYQPNVAWTLSSGNGTKTVNAEIRDGSGIVRTASDTIELNVPGPALSVSPGALAFALQHDGPLTQTIPLTIQNTGQLPLNWSLSGENTWLSASASNGTVNPQNSTNIQITVSRNGLSPAVYTTTLMINAGDADNSPQTVDVTFLITDQSPVFLPAILK